MTMIDNRLANDCDRYLAARTATYDQRAQRYAATHHVIEMHGGLDDNDILLDFGAGGTDLDVYLRRSHLWRGRYWPVDGWQGTDLRWWAPKRAVSWTVALEVIEHLPMELALQQIEAMKGWSTKGVVLSTPNALAVDVLEMDDTHVWGAIPEHLHRYGYTTEVTSLYGRPNDSILAWWTP